MHLALFDLDHTLLPIDSDYEWGQFLVRMGAVDSEAFQKSHADWFAHYQAGTLDPVNYLRFVFGTLARFSRTQLDTWHQQFMLEVIAPQLHAAALDLVKHHQQAGDLVAIVTATNRFITAPIARCFEVDYLIAADAEMTASGDFTGNLLGTPTYGPGKVTHTQAWLVSRGQSIEHFSRSYFYSDSHNDIPLLSLVTDPIATNPNAKLQAHAQAKGWKTIHLWTEDKTQMQ